MELKVRNLDVGYGNKIVIHNINLENCRGKMICLVGPNGAGKSTILKTLSNELAPLGGTIFLDEENIKSIKSEHMAKKLSVVLTDKIDSGMMTGFDIVAMGRYPHTGFLGKLQKRDFEIIDDVLKKVHAEKLVKKLFTELSDGEKQKILLARALCQEPQIIILDEPTSYLDIRHKIEFICILNDLVKEEKLTVVMSLHEIDIALKSCDIIIMVKDGNVQLYENSKMNMEDENIKKLYELTNVGFNSLLGTYEIQNPYPPYVFVVGGNGAGVPIFRFLTKNHIGFSTGILCDNDIDYYVANTMNIKTISSAYCSNIENSVLDQAFSEINKVSRVIDCGFNVGKLNTHNVDLILYAVENNKKVYTFRNKSIAEAIYGKAADNFIYCIDLEDIISSI